MVANRGLERQFMNCPYYADTQVRTYFGIVTGREIGFGSGGVG